MRLLIMGPPGAGKGTQAAFIARSLGIPHISTGDIFRANVTQGTQLGIEASRYLDAGEYVPDSVTNAMVRDRLSQDDCNPGFLLDGYPRTPEQVGELDAILHSDGHNLDTVIELTVEIDAVVARLVKRAQEQGRADDTEDVIRRRLELYADQTAPLLAIYRSRGILVQIDGLGDINDVTGRIFAVLGVEL